MAYVNTIAYWHKLCHYIGSVCGSRICLALATLLTHHMPKPVTAIPLYAYVCRIWLHIRGARGACALASRRRVSPPLAKDNFWELI